MRIRLSYSVVAAIVLLTGAVGCSDRPSRVRMDPGTSALLAQAEAAAEQGEYRRALSLSDSAVARSPQIPDVHFIRAGVLTRLNRLDDAKAAYERVLEIDPDYPSVHFRLGQDAFMRGRFVAAVRAYEREINLLGREKEAEERLARVYLQMGRAYKLLGKSDSARTAYEASMRRDSTNATTHAWLGELEEEEGDFEAALSYYRTAAAMRPDDVDFRYNVASTLLKTGHARESIPLLAAVLAQRPMHEGANYSLGQALLRTDRPEDAQAYLNRADTLQSLQADIAAAQAAAYQQSDRPDRWLELARLFLVAGRFEDARHAFSVVQYLEPENLAVRNDLANLALAMGDTTAAIARYQAALELNPAFADGWLNLGVVYAMKGDRAGARRAWAQALEVDPDHAEARSYLARLEEDGTEK